MVNPRALFVGSEDGYNLFRQVRPTWDFLPRLAEPEGIPAAGLRDLILLEALALSKSSFDFLSRLALGSPLGLIYNGIPKELTVRRNGRGLFLIDSRSPNFSLQETLDPLLRRN